MNITFNVSPELGGQQQQAAQRQSTYVTTYLPESARLRLRPDVLPEAEAVLLQTVNAPLAPEARLRRDVLSAEQTHWHLLRKNKVPLWLRWMPSRWRTRNDGRHL